jgi:transposase InsO family protein
MSERRACRVIGQCRATQHYIPHRLDDEDALRQRIVELARASGRYGSLRITALLREEGWRVNHQRVERIWREEGLKVPQKQPKRARLWLADGSCLRRRPAYPNPCLGL